MQHYWSMYRCLQCSMLVPHKRYEAKAEDIEQELLDRVTTGMHATAPSYIPHKCKDYEDHTFAGVGRAEFVGFSVEKRGKNNT